MPRECCSHSGRYKQHAVNRGVRKRWASICIHCIYSHFFSFASSLFTLPHSFYYTPFRLSSSSFSSSLSSSLLTLFFYVYVLCHTTVQQSLLGSALCFTLDCLLVLIAGCLLSFVLALFVSILFFKPAYFYLYF